MTLLLCLLLSSQVVDDSIKAAREATERGDSEGAEKHYTEALEKDPKNIRALAERAEARRRKGDLNRALEDCARLIEARPKAPVGYLARAEIRAHQGRYAEAIEDYDRAVNLVPTISKSYYLRGRVRLAIEDYNGAIADCTKAVELQPQGTMGYFFRGAVWGVKQSWKDALADFRKIQSLPETGALQDYAAVNIWICRARSGEVAEATAEIKEYVAKKPADAVLTPILRACRFLSGETSEKDYSDWVSAEASKVSVEDQCEAFLYVGHKRLCSGDKAGAEQYYEKSVKTGVRSCSEYHAASQALRVLRAR